VQLVLSSKIYVRPGSCFMMNQIEMTPMGAFYLYLQNICRWTIEFLGRESVNESFNVPSSYHDNQVQIVRQARLTIDD
jgi:hypothetical protein